MKIKYFSLLIPIFLFSCKTISVDPELEAPPISVESDIKNQEKTPTLDAPISLTVEDEIDLFLKTLTLEEKVGQLFMLEARTNINGNNLYSFDNSTLELLNKFRPGGIILFANNVKETTQVRELVTNLQNNSKIPLFIAVDEEGGIVSRLGKNKNVLVTHLPPALSIGNKNNPNLAYKSGLLLARELMALGINMNMAPVADVNTNPSNPVIGNRTYSSDPVIAGEMISEVVKGFHYYNLISVLKHFPGHGDTSNDTHIGSVISPHNIDRLNQVEFVPFRMGLASGADAIMTAHMLMPEVSSKPYPATLNPDIITNIIRKDFGFNGIVITDALDMGAITKNYTSGEAAKLSFLAGVDILLIPENPEEAYYTIIDEVNNGNITISRLDQSVKRILLLKQNRGILKNAPPKETSNDIFNDLEHKKLYSEIFN